MKDLHEMGVEQRDSNGRYTYWLPSVVSIQPQQQKSQDIWHIVFQEGEATVDLSQCDMVMFYGETGDLPIAFLADAATHEVCVMVHQEHASHPLVLHPHQRKGQEDVLTNQILCRENQRRRVVFAKACVRQRLLQTQWLKPISQKALDRLKAQTALMPVRLLESCYAKRHWAEYYASLGLTGNHQDNKPVSQALDSLSDYLQSIMLRWVYLHRLSPFHGFLHEPINATSLLHDLMEPVRHWVELAVHQSFREGGEGQLTARSMARLKTMLTERVEVPNLQIEATRDNILHGTVMAARAYIMKDMRNLVFPQDAEAREVRRPIKTSYEVPGAIRRYRG
ncbi:CRISPR-associated endonuclease Cas1 [Neptuniibacter sp. QD37_11]|uniref:CRISPR-associated endonuclease Cas1 n=1 Tax=Neptuniibacter sp. QD37_11 TaxID=3398209 RepID=UPI0039F5CD04